MTKLERPLRREITNTISPSIKKPVIIQLEPPNFIKFKEKGRRLWYETTIEACYFLAVRQFVQKQKQEKQRLKKLKQIVKRS